MGVGVRVADALLDDAELVPCKGMVYGRWFLWKDGRRSENNLVLVAFTT